MKKNMLIISILFLITPSSTLAAQLNNPLTGNTDTLSIIEILGNIISTILGVSGVIATVMIIWGAIKMITAQGNDQAISDAKSIIFYSIIGLIIAFAGFIVVSYIITNLEQFAGFEPRPAADELQQNPTDNFPSPL